MNLKIPVLILLGLAVGTACSCRHPGSPSAEVSAPQSRVAVAVVDPKMADHVTEVLKEAGIISIVEGSVVYGVSVPSESKEAAIAVLKKDSERLKYWIEFK